MKKNISRIVTVSALLVSIVPTNLSASTMELGQVETQRNQEYIHWSGKEGQRLNEKDIIYLDSGEKYIINVPFESKGGNEQLDSDLVTQLVDTGDEIITPAESNQERMQTCIGDSWHTKKTGVSKTNITNSYFGTKKRKASAYHFSGSKQKSLSVKIEGYGVTIKYDKGTGSGGNWEVPANPKNWSRVKNNVKGNIQQKELSNCSTSTRFVETHEWATVKYYAS